jgi:hypothetical protein
MAPDAFVVVSHTTDRPRGGPAWPGRWGLVLPLLLGLLSPAGCFGTSEPPEPPAVETIPVDKGLFDETWPMQVVDAEARAPYEGMAFVAHILDRDYRASVRRSDGTPGLATARFHADAAALFRQAALATGNSYVEYFDPPMGQEYDPVEKVHLLMVGKTLKGDLDGARSHLDAVKALPETSGVRPWAAPWLAWYEAGATWPPDLSGLPVSRPPPTPGTWPEVTERPSYTVSELPPGDGQLSFDDPALLLQLALWHDAAARKAAGDKAAIVDLYGARYRLPVEPDVAAEGDLPLEFRFGTGFLHVKDGAFMADVVGAKGADAIDAWKDRSFLAAVLATCRDDSGKIDNVAVVDAANELRMAWKEEQASKAGLHENHHPIFADVAVAGLYRNAALVAEVQGDREVSGKLRIAARDIEREAAAAPEGLLALTAWDADNQMTIRGAEIIHQQARRAPSLEVVRTALDLIGIRVGRSRSGGTPGM